MVWWLLISVVGEMNMEPNKFEGIPRHCILYVWHWISKWWLHPRFPLIPSKTIMCTANNDNCYPCKNIWWSDIVDLFSMMASIWGKRFFGFRKDRDKEWLSGLISITVFPFLRYDQYIVCIVLCHFGYVINHFQWKDEKENWCQTLCHMSNEQLP